MTCSSEGVMPTPQALKDAWDEARSQTERGDPEDALKTMRSAWDTHGKDADDHRTWTIVADAEAKIAGESTRPKDYRKSIKHYEKALDKGAGKDVRRQMNKVRADMDERGIGMGSFRLYDDGSPTVYGVFALFAVGMLLLVSLRYVDGGLDLSDIFASDDDDSTPISVGSTAQLSISYVPAGMSESDRVTVAVMIDLYSEDAPVHVDNFVKLAQNGDYDNTIFHRIIDNFMIQGGDFTNMDGTGGHAAEFYGYCNGQPSASACSSEDAYTIPDEANNGRVHDPCTLSMAKTSSPNTGGSQFFVIPEDSNPTHLDGVHTVFGTVTSGCSFVTAISSVDTGSNDRPVYDVRLESVTIS
jgi:cyclophilin family peptidyl-prolyl cis-trans isomerase